MPLSLSNRRLALLGGVVGALVLGATFPRPVMTQADAPSWRERYAQAYSGTASYSFVDSGPVEAVPPPRIEPLPAFDPALARTRIAPPPDYAGDPVFDVMPEAQPMDPAGERLRVTSPDQPPAADPTLAPLTSAPQSEPASQREQSSAGG